MAEQEELCRDRVRRKYLSRCQSSAVQAETSWALSLCSLTAGNLSPHFQAPNSKTAVNMTSDNKNNLNPIVA